MERKTITANGLAFSYYDYIVVPKAGHFLHREVPETFNQQTIAFLQD